MGESVSLIDRKGIGLYQIHLTDTPIKLLNGMGSYFILLCNQKNVYENGLYTCKGKRLKYFEPGKKLSGYYFHVFGFDYAIVPHENTKIGQEFKYTRIENYKTHLEKEQAIALINKIVDSRIQPLLDRISYLEKKLD